MLDSMMTTMCSSPHDENIRKHEAWDLLAKLSVMLCLAVIPCSKADVLWSADFESPAYAANADLTGQQGWWHYQGWTQGWVETFGSGQRAGIGGFNGYSSVVLTPYLNTESPGDKRFKISVTVNPGNGSSPCLIRVLDNSPFAALNVQFDDATGHIQAKGVDTASWIDTGVAYTAGTDYRLEIYKDDNSCTFDLKVNDVWALRGIDCGSDAANGEGIAYLYFSGGGNNGAYIPDEFTFLDNIAIETQPDFERVWSANFESPAYTANTDLTSQQGWWHYQDWTQGWVETFGNGQRAGLGGTNGYPQLVLSPWINVDTSGDKCFRISLTVKPGNGNQACAIRLLDNVQTAAVNVQFDKTTGHIQAKGTDSTTWVDTGLVYAAGNDYWLEIYKNDIQQTFSLCVNGTMVMRNVSTGITTAGVGYLYILGGGNTGVPIANQYTYLDDVGVDVLADVDGDVIWSADFDVPGYVAGYCLTGQGGWWNYQGWSQGCVEAFGDGQRAKLGATNGYAEVVLTPWTNRDTASDKRFRISLTVTPGNGSEACAFRLLDDTQTAAVNVKFDKNTSHIQAKGTDTAPWIDTGVVYAAGNDYRLEIVKDDVSHTFSLKVNGNWVIGNLATGLTSSGIGYLYLYGGGNNGVPIANQYTYLDNMVVEVLSCLKQSAWPVGAYDRMDYLTSPTEMSAEGANITVGYQEPYLSLEKVGAWLDRAYLRGLRVIVETPREPDTAHITSDPAVITNFINKFKDHPAVYGWYIADESGNESHAIIKAGYDLIKTLSVKPVSMAFTLDTGTDPYGDLIVTYADSYDVALVDCYITIQGLAEFYYMATPTFQARINYASQKAVMAGKPWWAVMQGYGRTLSPPYDPSWMARLPSYKELKFMVYYCICLEATGTSSAGGWLSWCHWICKDSQANAGDPYPGSGIQWLNETSGALAAYRPLVAEINTLGPALSGGKKTGLTDNQTLVLGSLYRDPVTLEYYILAVNNYNGNRTTTFTINSSVGTFRYAQPLSEGRSNLTISSRKFSDSFTRFQVHVYKLIP